MSSWPAPRPATRAPTWWPQKGPLENLTWSETITPYVSPTDVISTVSASIAPSGSGELTAETISVLGQTISLTLTGGVGGRIYTIQFVVTMTNGSIYQPTVQIACRSVLATYPIPPAPSVGFGTAIVWSGGTVSFTTGLVGTAVIAAAGTNQGTATQVYAVTTVINSGVAGGGVILPAIAGLIYGTLEIIDIWSGNVLLYPAVGDAFEGMSANEAVTVLASSGDVRVVLSEGATAWVIA